MGEKVSCQPVLVVFVGEHDGCDKLLLRGSMGEIVAFRPGDFEGSLACRSAGLGTATCSPWVFVSPFLLLVGDPLVKWAFQRVGIFPPLPAVTARSFSGQL